MNVKKEIDCRQLCASRGFLARPSAAFMVGICWGNQTPRMPALKIPLTRASIRGPEEIRTPDLTRASRAKGIHGHLRRSTFSAICAGRAQFRGHSHSHLLTPIPGGDVGDLLGSPSPEPTARPFLLAHVTSYSELRREAVFLIRPQTANDDNPPTRVKIDGACR